MAGVFSTPNDRIFYGCHGVWYKSRVTTQSGGNDSISGSTFLKGVQSVGVSTNPGDRRPFLDVGRMNQTFGAYGQPDYEISISRVIHKAGDFFYNVSAAGGSGAEGRYENGHVLSTKTSHTIGNCGASNRLKNYDITLVVAPDDISYIGESSPTRGVTYQTKTYRCCLLNSVSYSIGVDGAVTEDLTFTTSVYTQDNATPPSAGFEHSEEVVTRSDIQTSLCEFPEEVQRMFDLGTSDAGIPVLGLQNIEISMSINYQQLQDTGQWRGSGSDRAEQNLYTYVQLPVEVTASFSGVIRAQYRTQSAQDHEVTDTYFTAADGTDSGVDNYKTDRSIIIVANADSGNYFQWNLGDRNFVDSMSISGGDTGGGNMEGTVSYRNESSEIFLLKGSSVLDFTNPNIY